MTALVWLHEDALRRDHPVFEAAGEQSESCFIWDAAYLQSMDYSFKRLVFIYETLCELPVRIYRGDILATLSGLIEARGTHCLYIPASPNPLLRQSMQDLQARVEVRVIADVAFTSLPEQAAPKRFHRYWKQVREELLR